MALLDENRCHADVNGAYLKLLGYPRDALIGQPVRDLVIGGPIMTPEQWRTALAQTQFTGVVDVRRRDGGRVTVEFAGHPAILAGRQFVLGVVLRADRRGRRAAHQPAPGSATETLTKRELDVVRLIALGATGPEIADELHVSNNTVRTHVRNAMTKLGARSRAHLVAKALTEVLYREDAP